MQPKLAAFPKCFMDELCVHRTMSLLDWIEMASTLGVDGLEFYSGFIYDDPGFLNETKAALEGQGLAMPMLCCSPDFTVEDPGELRAEIDRQKRMVEIAAFFGGGFCRVLSGQRRPGLDEAKAVDQVVRCIEELLPTAQEHGVVLNIENHYKDGYWTYPEFAQSSRLFLQIVERIDSPWFGVNFDPSNAIVAGEDPIELLEKVKHRVVTMHGSDRYLTEGTMEDLHREEIGTGYASRLAHGVIGRGLNDYDRIFEILHSVDFSGWISIEDGMNGMDELRESVRFLRRKIGQHFPAAAS